MIGIVLKHSLKVLKKKQRLGLFFLAYNAPYQSNVIYLSEFKAFDE